jgi:polysaccharide biosynthesis/export protein
LKKSKRIIVPLLLALAAFLPQLPAHAEETAPAPARALQAPLLRPAALPASTSWSAPRPAEAAPAKNGAEARREEAQEKGRELPSAAAPLEPAELSPIEKAALADATPLEKPQPQPYRAASLTQFGYNFFRGSQPGFAPLGDIPVGPDYVLGPGDRIVLSLWGGTEGTHELEVNRSGEVILPKVGSVRVWGISFGRLPGVLKAHLARYYKDLDLAVSMGKLRSTKVFVVGEVKAPGDYTLAPLSTLINALSACGGPLKSGTLRNIQVRRGGKVVETVDLYDFFLRGDKSRDIRLQPGDTIFVPVIGKVAGMDGSVKRPALYELKDETNLGELIALAGGFLPTGYLQRVQISRVDAHEKKVVADFNIEPRNAQASADQLLAKIRIQDLDVVRIFPIDATLREHVRLDGYVLRPGNYALKPGLRLSGLLMQDNLLPEYYKEAAEVTRLYAPDYHAEKIYVDVARALSGDPAQDLELKEFDVVRIFSRWEMEDRPKVRVSGEVQRPGEYQLFPNMTVRDLLLAAGNPKTTAYLEDAEINRLQKSGREVSSFPIVINLQQAMRENPKDNLVLTEFDELTVRKLPNWAEEKERYITLKGEFRFPGVYPIYRGEKLSAVIERAGGFTGKAYLRGARFTRLSVRELQQRHMDEQVARTEKQILKRKSELASVAASKEELEATNSALESLERTVSLLKSAKAEGRLTIHMESLDRFRNSQYDVELMGGDVLEVPAKPNAISVLGQVYNPTSFIPVDNEKLGYYLEEAGGVTRDAEKSDMYLVRVDGTVVSRQQVSGFRSLFGSGFDATPVEPGDTIVVPQCYEKIAWMREIKDIAVILGNLALTAGVLVAAGL